MKQVITKVAGVKLADGTMPPKGTPLTLTDAEAARLEQLDYVTVEETQLGAGGGGGVDLSVVQAAVAEAVAAAVEPLPTVAHVEQVVGDAIAALPTPPPGGDPAQVLAKASEATGDFTWVDPVGSIANVRLWEAPELVWVENFENGAPSAAPWTVSLTAASTLVAVAMSASTPASKPALNTALRLTNAAAGTHSLTLDLDAIPALAGKTPLQVKYWWAVTRVSTAATPTFNQKDGATVRLSQSGFLGNNTTPWVQQTSTIGSLGNDQKWEFVTSVTTAHQLWLAGVEVYASPEPYMLNEIVRYNGNFYRSLQDNNPNIPSSGLSWQLV